VTFFRPFNNPTETYRYYSLPFCHIHEQDEAASDVEATERRLLELPAHTDGAIKHGQRLGQSLVGDARETSPYQVTFRDLVDWRFLCSKTYTSYDLQKFKKVISNYYFFEMFLEDIPMWVRDA
jgi:transmembrane 9 superfamily member 1